MIQPTDKKRKKPVLRISKKTVFLLHKIQKKTKLSFGSKKWPQRVFKRRNIVVLKKKYFWEVFKGEKWHFHKTGKKKKKSPVFFSSLNKPEKKKKIRFFFWNKKNQKKKKKKSGFFSSLKKTGFFFSGFLKLEKKTGKKKNPVFWKPLSVFEPRSFNMCALFWLSLNNRRNDKARISSRSPRKRGKMESF